MRRIFRNSTALALGVSMSLPQIASAQVLAAAEAPEIAATRIAAMPELGQRLQAEIDKGLTADALTCLMNAPKPCPEGTAQFTPSGIAVQLVDDGTFILAPADQQVKTVEGGELVPSKDAPLYSAPRSEAETASVEVAQADTALTDSMERGRGGDPVILPEGTTTDAARAAVEAEAQADTAVAAEPPAAEETKSDAAAAAAGETAAPEPAAQPDAQAAADPVVETPPGEAKAEAAPVVVPEAKAEATAEPPVAPTVEPTADASPSAADLADALSKKEATATTEAEAAPVVVPATEPKADDPAAAREAVAGAQAADTAVTSTGSTEPVVAGTAETDAAATPTSDALAETLAAATAIPEVNAKETAGAREAAAVAEAPAAAALLESSAPVVTTEKSTVTEATSRQATEDFATDVKGTQVPVVGGTASGSTDPVVVGGTTTTPSADSKDDDSDLEKALKQAILPALAGLAVGQMLSNNREVALNTGDRVVVTRADGSQEILKDDNVLLLRPGSTVQTDEFADGSSRTVVTREDGSQVVTIRDADLRILRRTVVHPDGTTTALIDETAAVQPVDVAQLPRAAEPVVVMPGQPLSEETLRDALRRETQVDRSFTLGQIRAIPEVRALVAPVDIQAITFDTGSAAIKPDQAQALASLGRVLAEQIRQNPGEVFLIEGHTDTVGKDAMNLALSDRRAESVALALTEFFKVPPENMVVQGYGEQFLKVAREGDVRANRRAAVRRITDLLARK